MTEDGMYGSTLANSLNTNTDVEMSSFKNNTVAATGADIGCFDSKPYWNTLNSTWNNMYSVINYANDFLHEMENSSLFSLQIKEEGPTEIQQMYGEVKTLRAMLYLDLIRTWGDVVFVTEPSKSTDDFFSVGVTERNKILEYLIDELIDVEPMMKYAADLDYGVERASANIARHLSDNWLCIVEDGLYVPIKRIRTTWDIWNVVTISSIIMISLSPIWVK